MPPRHACAPAQDDQVKVLLELGVVAKNIRPLIKPPINYRTVAKMKKNFADFRATKAPQPLTI